MGWGISSSPTETPTSAPSKTGSKMATEPITGSATIKYIPENGMEACPTEPAYTSGAIRKIDMKECFPMG